MSSRRRSEGVVSWSLLTGGRGDVSVGIDPMMNSLP